MKTNYIYNAKIVKIVDGDTVDAIVDLGFYVFTHIRFRLHDIDTPELTSTNPAIRDIAKNAKEYLIQQILDKDVTLTTYKTDKYGRWLAVIHSIDNTQSINEQLIALGLAKQYSGGNRTGLWSI